MVPITYPSFLEGYDTQFLFYKNDRNWTRSSIAGVTDIKCIFSSHKRHSCWCTAWLWVSSFDSETIPSKNIEVWCPDLSVSPRNVRESLIIGQNKDDVWLVGIRIGTLYCPKENFNASRFDLHPIRHLAWDTWVMWHESDDLTLTEEFQKACLVRASFLWERVSRQIEIAAMELWKFS